MDKTMQIVIYEGNNGSASIEVYSDGDTLGATQKAIAELFSSSKQNVHHHLSQIFDDGELDENSVVKYYSTTEFDLDK